MSACTILESKYKIICSLTDDFSLKTMLADNPAATKAVHRERSLIKLLRTHWNSLNRNPNFAKVAPCSTLLSIIFYSFEDREPRWKIITITTEWKNLTREPYWKPLAAERTADRRQLW